MPRPLLSSTLLGVLVCSLLILFGPLYTTPGYSVIAHTSSDLGAQNTPYNWLMNIGFVALALGVGLDARRVWWQAPFISVMFMLFAAAMALTGVFSLRPIDPALPFDDRSHMLHSVCATIVGVCFCVGAIGYGFYTRSARARLVSFAASISATLLSLGIFMMPDLEGLLQRLMFLITFSWLAIYLPRAARPEGQGK